MFLAGALSCATTWAQSPTCNITSPASSATINGTSFLIAGTIASAASAYSVEIIFDGDSQGIIWLTPGQQNWSMTWNTNVRFDTPGYGWVTANVRDASGASICTATNTGITINNQFWAPAATIKLSSITLSNGTGGSGCTGTTWTGQCVVTAVYSGSAAGTDNLQVYTLIDGDYRVSQTTQTTETVYTAQWPNGKHLVCAFAWDLSLNNGIGEWCQQTTFSNSNAASEIIVTPRNWTIGASGTIQLTCSIRNADGSSGGSCPSPTWDTTDTTTISNATPHSTRICSVSNTGLVTGTSGINFGACLVTVAVSGFQPRWIAGQISNSPGPIAHFGSDGQIHTTCTGTSTCMWVASVFDTGSSNNTQGFNNPLIQSRTSLLGGPINQVGFNTLEPSAADAGWQGSQSNLTTQLNARISAAAAYATPFNLYYHPNLSSVISCSGAGGGSYANADAFWDYTYGDGGAMTPPAVSQVAAAWQATGRVLGFTSKDEMNAYSPFTYPGPVGTIGAAGGPTNILVDASGNATVNWPAAAGALVGTDYAGCSHAIRISGTGTGLDNGTSPFAYSLTGVNPNGTQMYFTAPAGVTSLTVNSGTINAFGYNNEDGAGSFIPNNGFDTFMSQFRTASPHPTLGHPMATNTNFGSTGLAAQWCGNQNYSDFCELYLALNSSFYYGPQNASLMDLVNLSPGSFANNGIPSYIYREAIGNAGSQRAFLGYTSGVLYNYYLTQPHTLSGWTCSGNTCTAPSDHGIRNVLAGCATQITISGSTDANWNATFCVTAAPTSTTLKVARESIHGSDPGTKTDGTINWADGTTSGISAISVSGGIIKTVNDNCVHRGQDFTISGGTGSSYWTTTTFYNRAFQQPLPTVYCSNSPGAYNDEWLEYLPAGESSGTISVKLWPDLEYHQGVYQGGYNAGFLQTGWNLMEAAIARASGTRTYPNIGPYYSYVPFGLIPSVNNSNLQQPGPSPLYNNGDGGMIPDFWSYAPATLMIERLASTGYLYGTPVAGGCPDLGFLFDCDLRQSSNGNLLMTLSALNAPQTRTVDISACSVAGQPTIRYTIDITGIAISTLAAGTTSDTPTWPAGGGVFYLCSNNEAAEYSPPVISVLLADISGASQIVLRYAPTPYQLNTTTADTVNCGTGTCTIPWDRKIGTLYYKLIYLNSSGEVVASSDVQSL